MSMRRRPESGWAERAEHPVAADPAGLEVVVFDLDGVLVDSRRPIAACLNAALVDHGLAAEPEGRLHRFIGPPLRDAFLSLLAARGADPELAPACVARYRHHYREASLSGTTLFPGVPELLDELARSGRRLAVATSKPEAFARPILAALGLAPRLACIVGPPLERTHEEDKSATLGRALAALGHPRRAAMVGDRDVDMHAARRHGCLAVGALWGIGSAEELRRAGAHRMAEDPPALARLLEPEASGSPPRSGPAIG